MRANNRFMRVHAMDVCACMFTCTNQTARVAVWLKLVPFNVCVVASGAPYNMCTCVLSFLYGSGADFNHGSLPFQ